MAANMFIPPWMQVQYNPVQTFLKAFQTGAQIRQAQTKLAEEQRQANMQAQARQEQLQQNALLEAARIQTEKAYRQQQAQLQQSQLMETAKRNAALQQASIARIEEVNRHNQALELLRQNAIQNQAKQAALPKIHFTEHGGVLSASPTGEVKVLREAAPPEAKSSLRISTVPGEEGSTRVSGNQQEVEAYLKAQEEAQAKAKEEAAKNSIWNKLRTSLGGVPMQSSGMAPSVLPNAQAALPFQKTTKSLTKEAVAAAYRQSGGNKAETERILKAQGYEF